MHQTEDIQERHAGGVEAHDEHDHQRNRIVVSNVEFGALDSVIQVFLEIVATGTATSFQRITRSNPLFFA